MCDLLAGLFPIPDLVLVRVRVRSLPRIHARCLLKNCYPMQCRISQLGLDYTAAEPSITRPASTEPPRAVLEPQDRPAPRSVSPSRPPRAAPPRAVPRAVLEPPRTVLEPSRACTAPRLNRPALEPPAQCLSRPAQCLSRLGDWLHGLSLALPSSNLKNCRLMQRRNSRPGLVFTAAAAPSLTRPASTPRLGQRTKTTS
jgi:hypothetical protein